MILANIFLLALCFGLLECFDIKVAYPYEEGGAEPCLRLCTGTTGKGATPWNSYGTNGLYVDVDMTKCDFVSDLTPIVTSSLAGGGHIWTTTGGSEIYNLKYSGFRNYINLDIAWGDIKSYYRQEKWRIDWQAIGYTC